MKIAGWALGLSLAVAGVGAAIGTSPKTEIETKAAGEKTYRAYSGDITEGDYIVVYDGSALKNTISSSRLTYSAVTISSNQIYTAATDIVWHIAPSGDYWTLYNAAVSKYAGSTGSKNQAALIASINNNAKWTVTGSTTYEFENLARSTGSNSGNKWLRKNGTYGFACYASDTGGALSLYKLQESSSNAKSLDLSPSSALTIDGENVAATKTGTITYKVNYDGDPGPGLVHVSIKKGGADTEELAYVDDGEGTITLTAYEVGTYTVTIITQDEDSSGNPISHDVIVTVQNLKSKPAKVTSTSNLHIGDVVYFVNETASVAAGSISGDYLSSKTVSILEDKITDIGDAIGLILGRNGDNYTFRTGSSYLGATAAKKINLSSNGTTDWALSFSDSNAVVNSTSDGYGNIQYNTGSPRFLNYASAQAAIQMYVLSATDAEVAAEFETMYLVMDKNVSGQCNTYYANAKTTFATLTPTQVSALSEAAINRLAAWAAAKGDTFNVETRKFGAAMIPSIEYGFSSGNNLPLVLTVAALGTAAAAGFFLFQRKRKEN